MPADAIITVQGLTKKFGELTAVNNVSFSVHRGEVFAFLGPNGAGKTTTIKMLTTLLHPTSGVMHINGHDPMHDQDAVRKTFGIVFQDQSLDDELTAWENMELHGVLYSVERTLRHKRIDELLERVGLQDRRKDLVKTFSGGMRRRLEIARSLLHHPTILYLDEPTVGLDPQTRNALWEYVAILQGKEGITVFLTTHYMEEAERNAQRIAIIDHGTIVAEGTPKEILEKTNSPNLEEAFLELTGRTVREEEANAADRMRMASKMWRGRR